MSEDRPIYGLMGRFPNAEPLIAATRRCREQYDQIEAYSPFPIPELADALALGGDHIPRWALAGGIFGAVSGFLIQAYTAVIDYPIDVGGRPPFSWPAFLPISIILTLFWGAAGAVLGLFVSNRLPRLYHPVFNVAEFAAASRDGFFLVIRATDPAFHRERTRAYLGDLGAEPVEEVAE